MKVQVFANVLSTSMWNIQVTCIHVYMEKTRHIPFSRIKCLGVRAHGHNARCRLSRSSFLGLGDTHDLESTHEDAKKQLGRKIADLSRSASARRSARQVHLR